MTGKGGPGKQITSSLCGDGKCEGPETIDHCSQDCGQGFKAVNSSLWEKIIQFFKNLFGEKNENPKGEKPRGSLEEGICGNDLCEPSLGESKQSCPKDCSDQ